MFLFLMLLSSTNLWGFREYCAGKWPNDYKMQEYCIKKQFEASLETNKLHDRYGIAKLNDNGTVNLYLAPAGGEYRTIYINCVMKWKPDRTMVLQQLQNVPADFEEDVDEFIDSFIAGLPVQPD